MDVLRVQSPQKISMVVTTYQTDSLYTQVCLESIAKWKAAHHELIVVVHDESCLLRAYLEAQKQEGVIDILLFAESGHGHTKGFNLALEYVNSDVVFNISSDIMVGPGLVDHCAQQLRSDRQLGLVGWHWYGEGATWEGDELSSYRIHDESSPFLPEEHQEKIYRSKWFTGKLFKALKGPKRISVCNTSFFGMRTELLESIGGGFSSEYSHYWADDFLCYLILDQGLDVRHFDAKFRNRNCFHEFQYDNVDVEDRRRLTDELRYDASFLEPINTLHGGMSEQESVFLHLLGRALPERSVITNVGVWRGSSAIVLLDAMKNKKADFYFIDCFEDASVSAMSAQPPASREEFVSQILPFISPEHNVTLIRGNTLEMKSFPNSDFVFLDAGQTAECIRNDAPLVKKCLSDNGVAAFHDYGCSVWPAVKPEIDRVFGELKSHQTVGVYRKIEPTRLTYSWPV